MQKDKSKALALIAFAVANAAEYDRFWIENIYQNIYCGTSPDVHQQANSFVASWRNRYAGKILHPMRPRSIDLPQAVRTCSNGEEVAPLDRSDIDGWLRSQQADGAQEDSRRGKASGQQTAASNSSEATSADLPDSMNGFSLRNIGTIAPAQQ